MDNNHAGLREKLQIINKRKNIVLTVFGIIFGVTALGTFWATPIYEGTAQIIIERVETDNLTGRNRYQPIDPEFNNTQFQLIRSHAVAKRVVTNLGLDVQENNSDTVEANSKSSASSAFVDFWSSLFEKIMSTEPGGASSQHEETLTKTDLVARSLVSNVNVHPVRGSNITAVSYRSPDPELASLVTNAFISAYLEETLSMKMEATRRNLEWMTEKAEVERLKLQMTEKKLQDYMKEQDLVTLEDSVTIVPEKLVQLGRDLVRAESRTNEARLLYNKVRDVSGNLDAAETVLSISEGNSLDVLRAQILRAEQNIMELSNKYGSKHPTMVKAMGDLSVLKNKRRQEIGRITEKVKNQYELALSNENSLRAELNETKAESLVLNEKYTHYSELKREIETNRQLYDALLGKIKSQSITGETRPVNIWIVDEAKVPQSPIKPTKAANLLLGLAFGLLCGIGLALSADYFDNRIKASGDVERELGLPAIGSINQVKSEQIILDLNHSSTPTEFMESYNSLLTTLQLSSPGMPPKKILVTSSMAGEGKTTTAVNLAFTMVKNGSRVLLIDADLRKPSLHKVFKLNNKVGLSSYLAGAIDKPVVNRSHKDNLFVLPAGPPPPNPYDLLSSQRMKNLIESNAQDFDAVICDSPPVLSVADSRVLSPVFDGLILVVRARFTPIPLAKKGVELLQSVNSRILGVLINAVRSRDQEYYHYYSNYFEHADKPEQVVGPVATDKAVKKY